MTPRIGIPLIQLVAEGTASDGGAGAAVSASVACAAVVEGGVTNSSSVQTLSATSIGVSRVADTISCVVISLSCRCKGTKHSCSCSCKSDGGGFHE